mgnify:FL=1|jgi:acyl carrier protein
MVRIKQTYLKYLVGKRDTFLQPFLFPNSAYTLDKCNIEKTKRCQYMSDEEVVDIIIKELLVIMPNASDIASETNIVRDLSLDSLAVMDLVMALEDYFDISIPLDRIADTETVFQLAGVVQSLQTEVRA